MSLTTAATVLSRINTSELLIDRTRSGEVLEDLRQLASVSMQTMTREAENLMVDRQRQELAMSYGYREAQRDKPFAYSDGVAIIPIHGTLLNRFSYSWGYVTGYNFIRAQMNAALDDDDVQLIVFDINSGGGEAAGCFELSAEIAAARTVKSLLAVVDSNCYSAAYALATGAPKIVVTPSGGAGSIGVISMHVDISKALTQAGVVVSIIAEGEHKADGNPYEPLPKDVLKDIRDSVAKRYGEFVDLVTTNRSLDSQAIRDTQSRCYRADEALALGLIDEVKTPAEAVAGFLAELGQDDPDQKEDEEDMAITPAEQATIDQAQATAVANATATASAEAATAERARIKGIKTCANAEGRATQAESLAMNTSMSVEDANTLLGTFPKDAAEKPAPTAAEAAAAAEAAKNQKPGDSANHFENSMNQGKNPDVGDEGGNDQNAAKPSRASAAMKSAGIVKK